MFTDVVDLQLPLNTFCLVFCCRFVYYCLLRLLFRILKKCFVIVSRWLYPIRITDFKVSLFLGCGLVFTLRILSFVFLFSKVTNP